MENNLRPTSVLSAWAARNLLALPVLPEGSPPYEKISSNDESYRSHLPNKSSVLHWVEFKILLSIVMDYILGIIELIYKDRQLALLCNILKCSSMSKLN